jgi:hypothetical protein
MPREINIPAETIFEDIRTIEEVPNQTVSVVVGQTDSAGEFIVPQQYRTYVIEGENYIALNGAPTANYPDKPDGTYRNQDLWYFIDLLKQS